MRTLGSSFDSYPGTGRKVQALSVCRKRRGSHLAKRALVRLTVKACVKRLGRWGNCIIEELPQGRTDRSSYLLIDCNLPRPSFGRVIGLERSSAP